MRIGQRLLQNKRQKSSLYCHILNSQKKEYKVFYLPLYNKLSITKIDFLILINVITSFMENVKLKILVTGGAGFIASHVVDDFIAMGHELIIVDNLVTGNKKNINPLAKFYNVDICNREQLEEVFEKEKPEVVDHHAAQVNLRRSMTEPVFDAKVNLLGSLNLIEASKKYNVKGFIYVSTGGAVYGEPEHLPVKETAKIEPTSQYGVDKHTVEHFLYINKPQGLNYITLRYPNVYGPRQDPTGEAGVVAIFSLQMLKRTKIYHFWRWYKNQGLCLCQ